MLNVRLFVAVSLLAACTADPAREPAVTAPDFEAPTKVSVSSAETGPYGAGALHHAMLEHFGTRLRNGAIKIAGLSLDERNSSVVHECRDFFDRLGIEYRCDVDFYALKAKVDWALDRIRSGRQASDQAQTQERLDYYYGELDALTGEYPNLTPAEYTSGVASLQEAAFGDPLLNETESVEFYDAGEIAKDSYGYWQLESSLEPYYDPETMNKPF